MSKSKIEWTEVVWNPVTGCSKVSTGCKNCYAETIAKRFWGDRKFTDVICHEDRLDQPLHWKKPRMIFVNSMSDLFHEDVTFEFIDKVFAIMWQTPQHTYQILTKRPKRMLEYTDSYRMSKGFDGRTYPLPNVWLGVSVETQKTADERIPILLKTPAAVRWISAEPLLEQIEIREWLTDGGIPSMGKLHWVVVGGESGKNKRPFDCDWARKIRDDCKITNVPFFMKQVDKVQFVPKDLQIREYPRYFNSDVKVEE